MGSRLKGVLIRLSPTTWILRGWDTGFAVGVSQAKKKLTPQSWRNEKAVFSPRAPGGGFRLKSVLKFA